MHRDDAELKKFDTTHEDDFTPIIGVTEAHYHINIGKAFMAGDIFPAIPDDGEAVGLIQVGDSEIHSFLILSSQGDFEVRMYEEPTWSNAGTAMTIFNKNRCSSIVSGAILTHTPTITDVGLELPPAFIPGGTGGNRQGGSGDNFSSEIILCRNKSYLFKIINRSGGAADMMGRLEFYEPDVV